MTYDKAGRYLASTTVIPVQPREANDICWVETPFFSPSKLVASNGRIYMAVSCEGDNKIANDLTSAKLEAQMAPTAINAPYMFGAESVNFVVNGSTLHVAFVARGTDLTLKTTISSKQITNLLSDGVDLPSSSAPTLLPLSMAETLRPCKPSTQRLMITCAMLSLTPSMPCSCRVKTSFWRAPLTKPFLSIMQRRIMALANIYL